MQRLGDYRFNYSPVETMRFAAPEWVDPAGLLRLLDRFRPLGRSGDVYARLTGSCAVDRLNCIQERHGRAKGVSGWISSARAGSKGRDDRDRNDRDTVVVDSSAQAPKIGIEHSMELVGRNFKVSAIRDALRAAGSGRGVTLMISGELGIGKTRLAGVVADLAAGQKMVVLTGRASPSGSAPALWPWYQVLAGRPERDMLPSAADAGAVGEGLRARWKPRRGRPRLWLRRRPERRQ